MKITKYIHSCLLIEDEGNITLIDPGNYSYDAKILDINSLSQLDYLLITHEHPDHFYLPWVKEITAKFPQVNILTNSSIVEIIKKEGINAKDQSDEYIKIEPISHEKIWGVDPPANVMFTINNKFADPGDSHHFKTSVPVLAVPIQAPWGSTGAAVELIEQLAPKVVIPIHDWHWNDQARDAMYKRLEDYFKNLGINFITASSGETFNID